MKRLFLVASLAVLLPASAAAADFTASIGSGHVEPGKSFVLQLTLSGTKATAVPKIAALKQSFSVESEIHSANASGTNKSVNFSVDWQLTLLPRKEGLLTIPSVSIETTTGELHTAPIILHVERPTPPMPSQVTGDGSKVSISAKASTTTPYRNQPIRYIIKSVVQGGISKVALEDISVANAIVERQGKPNVYDAVEKGVPVRVVEVNYLITPLQAGKMVVPPAVLKGELQTPALAPMIDPFGGHFMLSYQAQQAMNFFSAYGGEPFAIASNQTALNVKPPIGAMDPWLPLRSLKITEDGAPAQPVRVGDLVTRKITLLAEGMVGSQLPSLEAQQNHEDFGVYADKPAMGQDLDGKTGAIIGWRKESYSLIPRKAGQLFLPAVKVKWWDVVNNKVATSELPGRMVTILPVVAKMPSASGVSMVGTGEGPVPSRSALAQSFWVRLTPSSATATFIYITVLFTVALSLPLLLLRKKTAPTGAKVIGAERTLKKIRTVEELRDFLRTYAQDRLGQPRNASLEEILLPPPKWWTVQEGSDAAAIIRSINANLYAGKPADLDDLKKRCRRIVTTLKRGEHNNRKNEELPVLNPS